MKKKRHLDKDKLKKGLSEVITVLIIILISLTAIAILWIVISSFISQNSQISQIESTFFNEKIDFKKIQINPTDGLQVNLSLTTTAGQITAQSINITSPPPQVDVVSAVDISGSMRECLNMTNSTSKTCCQNKIKGTWGTNGPWGNNYCYAISSANLSKCTPCGGVLLDSLTSAQSANTQLLTTIFEGPNSNDVGISTYNDSVVAKFSSNLTNNQGTLTSIINSWQSGGGTCICCGINDSKNKLLKSSSDRLKTIIVMSDGQANQVCNTSEPNTVQNAINDAINASCVAYSTIPNLTIYTVGLGSEADLATMASIAEKCGPGQNFSASDINDLVQLYQNIGEKIIEQYNSSHKFSYLEVIFYDNKSDSLIQEIDPPGPLETKDYQFNLSGQGLTAPIVKIEIYPVVSTGSGKEVIGSLFASWEKSA